MCCCNAVKLVIYGKKEFYHEDFQYVSDLLVIKISLNNLFTIDLIFVNINLITVTWQKLIRAPQTN